MPTSIGRGKQRAPKSLGQVLKALADRAQNQNAPRKPLALPRMSKHHRAVALNYWKQSGKKGKAPGPNLQQFINGPKMPTIACGTANDLRTIDFSHPIPPK